jgi:hypothetical protein
MGNPIPERCPGVATTVTPASERGDAPADGARKRDERREPEPQSVIRRKAQSEDEEDTEEGQDKDEDTVEDKDEEKEEAQDTE